MADKNDWQPNIYVNFSINLKSPVLAYGNNIVQNVLYMAWGYDLETEVIYQPGDLQNSSS